MFILWGIMCKLQIAIWKNLTNPQTPVVDVLSYGWQKEEAEKYLIPIDSDTRLIPDELLKIFKCGCSSESSCKSGHCACNKSRLSCSSFCQCENGIGCFNPFRLTVESEKEDVD